MRIVALIDERQVIERILRHLGLWPALRLVRRSSWSEGGSLGEGGEQGMRVRPSTGPPVAAPEERVVEPWLDDPFPDYDTDPVNLSSVALA